MRPRRGVTAAEWQESFFLQHEWYREESHPRLMVKADRGAFFVFVRRSKEK